MTKRQLAGLKNGKNNITKSALVDFIAGETGQTKKSTKETIDAFLTVVPEIVKAGGYITLAGFGTFKSETRKAYTMKLSAKQRKMLNTTAKTKRIPAKKSLKFTASKR